MSQANSRKPSTSNQRNGFAVATRRVGQVGGRNQGTQRSALLNVLNSIYPNTTRSSSVAPDPNRVPKDPH